MRGQRPVALCGCGCGVLTRGIYCRGHRPHDPARYPRRGKAGKIALHRERAERALGRPLPPGAEVHHADGSKNPNAPLVICQDHRYHFLLHVRTRVVKAGGDPDRQRICSICKRLKYFEEMTTAKNSPPQNRCKRCAADAATRRHRARRAAVAGGRAASA